jgi:Peptidase family M1 domain
MFHVKQILALVFIYSTLFTTILYSQVFNDKFRQLEEMLPTPNDQRTASGAPGKNYWQQKVDYKMSIIVDDKTQKLTGEETITYTNNSPDGLNYLWLQLDQNLFDKNSDTYKTKQQELENSMSFSQIDKMFVNETYDGGFKINTVTDANGTKLDYTVVKTMMRIDIPKTIKTNEKYSFKVKWWYNINDRLKVGGRSGYEYFTEDKNYLYTIAQYYPRLCVYSDVTGWQHKQFLGSGEFTLSFGDYEVAITVPNDHIVGATGLLQNTQNILSKTQIERLEKAKLSVDEPIMIVNENEAKTSEKNNTPSSTKTWVFKADNVRDFAFCSSRKFIWDAMVVKQKSGDVMAMSFYPKEGNPLWEKYSTKAVAHTLKWYSNYTFDYPYPVAISVHTDQIGMEYPMICFNGGRPEKDGTYSERTKYGMISVIIHEVGHNYFPMIVNSDERQWTWMDEGLNTYLQFLAESQWERNYPSRRGPANYIVDYMKGDPNRLEPIMTNSESLRQFGNNAYGKTATALNILRESIIGRDLFDFAFKNYSKLWKFKHPMPADFFRSIEDASGVDIDWFWRGWFYTTDNVDIALNNVKVFKLNTKEPSIEKQIMEQEDKNKPVNISIKRNKDIITKTQDEIDTKLRDYYTDDSPYEVNNLDINEYEKYLNQLNVNEKKTLASGMNLFELTFEMKGELLSPIIVNLNYVDGSSDLYNIPAEIWRYGDKKVKKVFKSNKDLKEVIIDPNLETADINTENNYFPPKQKVSRLELYKQKSVPNDENPMQRSKRAK